MSTLCPTTARAPTRCRPSRPRSPPTVVPVGYLAPTPPPYPPAQSMAINRNTQNTMRRKKRATRSRISTSGGSWGAVVRPRVQRARKRVRCGGSGRDIQKHTPRTRPSDNTKDEGQLTEPSDVWQHPRQKTQTVATRHAAAATVSSCREPRGPTGPSTPPRYGVGVAQRRQPRATTAIAATTSVPTCPRLAIRVSRQPHTSSPVLAARPAATTPPLLPLLHPQSATYRTTRPQTAGTQSAC